MQVRRSRPTAGDSCDGRISVLYNCLSWYKFVSTHLYHYRQLYNIHICLSVSLSVPFSDSLLFSRWRYARVAASNIFDRGQHGRLCSRPNGINGGHIASLHDTFVSSRSLEAATAVALSPTV